MRKLCLIFGIVAMFALGLGAAHAQQKAPIAVADANGVVVLPSGQVIRGYPPYERIYRTLPLKGAKMHKCDFMRVAEVRDPRRFCKRPPIKGRVCRHLECD